MKEINVDGEMYILKKDVEKLYTRNTEIKKQNLEGFKHMKVHFVDNCSVMGLGSFKLINNWNVTKISLDLLKRSIKIAENLLQDDEQSIVIACSTDKPLCIGAIKKEEFSGVIIAPRVEE